MKTVDLRRLIEERDHYEAQVSELQKLSGELLEENRKLKKQTEKDMAEIVRLTRAFWHACEELDARTRLANRGGF